MNKITITDTFKDNNSFLAEVNRLAETGDDLLISFEDNISQTILKELQFSLLYSPKHIAAVPLIYGMPNLPYYLKFPQYNDLSVDYADATKILSSIKKDTADYEIIRTATPYLILLKGDILKRFQGFKKIEELIKNEHDICDILNIYLNHMRGYGFSTIISNRALLNLSNCKHSFNLKMLEKSNTISSPIKRFAILKAHHKPRLLLSFLGLIPIYNGTAIYTFNMAKALIKNYQNIYDIDIICDETIADYFKLNNEFENIYFVNNINNIYDLGITFSQVFEWNIFQTLQKYCARIITTVLDAIMFRTGFTNNRLEELFIPALKYSDAILTISKTVSEDLKKALPFLYMPKIYPVLLGNMFEKSAPKGSAHAFNKPFKEYILIFGNNFKHKALRDIIPYISKIRSNFFIIGIDIKGKYNNIKSLPSGNLTQDIIDNLISNCKAILFPSEYEGFGLPIMEGLIANKRIILRNNDINNELILSFDKNKTHIITFDYYDELSSIIPSLDNLEEPEDISKNIRNITDIAFDTNKVIETLLNEKQNYSLILERDYFYNITASIINYSLSFKKFLKIKLQNHSKAMRFAQFVKRFLKL